MANELSKFVESWFFDYFCKAKDCKSQDEFVDRVWGLYSYDNDDDVDVCINAAVENGFVVTDSLKEIQNDLADYAGDVVWELYDDGMLPNKYAVLYEQDIYDE
jgi:hypothetical protein